jgi:hypothetical protein
MGFESESPFDSLWQEYARVFQDWDDLTLAPWSRKAPGKFTNNQWQMDLGWKSWLSGNDAGRVVAFKPVRLAGW